MIVVTVMAAVVGEGVMTVMMATVVVVMVVILVMGTLIATSYYDEGVQCGGDP